MEKIGKEKKVGDMFKSLDIIDGVLKSQQYKIVKGEIMEWYFGIKPYRLLVQPMKWEHYQTSWAPKHDENNDKACYEVKLYKLVEDKTKQPFYYKMSLYEDMFLKPEDKYKVLKV